MKSRVFSSASGIHCQPEGQKPIARKRFKLVHTLRNRGKPVEKLWTTVSRSPKIEQGQTPPPDYAGRTPAHRASLRHTRSTAVETPYTPTPAQILRVDCPKTRVEFLCGLATHSPTLRAITRLLLGQADSSVPTYTRSHLPSLQPLSAPSAE